MRLNNLTDLYIDQLQDAYSAEQQLLEALPKMVEAAHDNKLKKTLRKHLSQTQEQLSRLNEVFSHIQVPPGGQQCIGMAALIKEGEKAIVKEGDPAVIDAALIADAQRVEHYEMAMYGTLRTYANLLNDKDAADLMQETLDQEGKTDRELTKLATGGFMKSGVNEKAKK